MSARTCKSCGAVLVKGENNHAPWCPKAAAPRENGATT